MSADAPPVPPIRTAGAQVSAVPVLDSVTGLAYKSELDIYAAALSELSVLTPAEFAARYVEYTDVRELASHAHKVLESPEAQSRLFSLTKHGIVKNAGAGGVCALVKTELPLEMMARRAMAEAGMAVAVQLYCSWDSVCYLGPSQVADADCPAWLHRDQRLGEADTDGIQLMVNLTGAAQDGPAGDACFVYVPGSHSCPAATMTAAQLVEAGADPASVGRLFASDFVMASAAVKSGDASTPANSLLWPEDAPLVRACLPPFGAVAWDSRVLHCGTLFTVPGRPYPRRTKYVHYFGASGKASTRTTRLAQTKTRAFGWTMVRADDAYTMERFELDFPGVAPRVVYPIAVTTAHRGTRKNNAGKFDLFRSGKRERHLTELNEKLDHPLVRNFFSLPYMLARALQLQFPASLAGKSCAEMAGLCAATMAGDYYKLRDIDAAASDKVRRLAQLHGM